MTSQTMLLAAAVLTATILSTSTSARNTNPRMAVGQTVARSSRSGIVTPRKIVIYGEDMGCFVDDPVIVREPRLLRCLAMAVRSSAPRRYEFADAVDTMEIFFRSGERERTLTVSFNARFAKDYFGLAFESSLASVGAEQALEARTLAMRLRPGRVVEITLPNTTLRSRTDIDRFITMLRHASPRDWDYTDVRARAVLGPRILPTDGRTIDLKMVDGCSASYFLD